MQLQHHILLTDSAHTHTIRKNSQAKRVVKVVSDVEA